MDTPNPLKKSAHLLDDLESIRQLLGDDNLQPPLLTDTVETVDSVSEEGQIPMLFDQVGGTAPAEAVEEPAPPAPVVQAPPPPAANTTRNAHSPMFPLPPVGMTGRTSAGSKSLALSLGGLAAMLILRCSSEERSERCGSQWPWPCRYGTPVPDAPGR